MLDLVVSGGTVVTPGTLSVCDVGVADGRIVQLGYGLRGRREIEAKGKYVLPGGVDVHVHLTPPVDPASGAEVWCDDFYTGSLAAIAGGITTLGNMTFQRRGETIGDAIIRDLATAERDAAVDFLLHPVLTQPTDESLRQIPDLAADGHLSLKIFMSTDYFDAEAIRYFEALKLAGRSGALTMFHCEDGTVIRCLCRALLAQGMGDVRYYSDSRPPYTEALAVERAIAFARAAEAPIYIVHLSSGAALEACRRARADGLPVYVETRPLYLYLTRDEFQRPTGAMHIGAPPLREATDVRSIWHALRFGDIECVCSDHAPWTRAQKLDLAVNIGNVRAGVPDLETLMPMLFSEGVRKKRISLSRFVDVTSTNPAKLFGLYPRKGTIAVGADADLVVWDPETRRTIDGTTMRSNAGYSPYDGWDVVGWPLYTVSRGEVVLESGEITAPRGRGRWLPRSRVENL